MSGNLNTDQYVPTSETQQCRLRQRTSNIRDMRNGQNGVRICVRCRQTSCAFTPRSRCLHHPRHSSVALNAPDMVNPPVSSLRPRRNRSRTRGHESSHRVDSGRDARLGLNCVQRTSERRILPKELRRRPSGFGASTRGRFGSVNRALGRVCLAVGYYRFRHTVANDEITDTFPTLEPYFPATHSLALQSDTDFLR